MANSLQVKSLWPVVEKYSKSVGEKPVGEKPLGEKYMGNKNCG